MKCPVLAVGYMAFHDAKVWEKCACIKEQCAWWDRQNEQCAVLTLGVGLWLVNKELLELLTKMPHVGQFTK